MKERRAITDRKNRSPRKPDRAAKRALWLTRKWLIIAADGAGRTPGRVEERLSDRTSDRISDRLCNRTSDRIFDRLPVSCKQKVKAAESDGGLQTTPQAAEASRNRVNAFPKCGDVACPAVYPAVCATFCSTVRNLSAAPEWLSLIASRILLLTHGCRHSPNISAIACWH